ncbi:MAG: alpha/beta hydrolase [Woeseiaceae bacterium]
MFDKSFRAASRLCLYFSFALSMAVYAQTSNTLVLEPCRIDAGSALPTAKARCGTFSRPENPNEPDGQQIELRIALVPALSVQPQPDPLIIFAGGPGQGAIESYLSLRGAFEPIRQKRDVLLIDQRGTGGSNKMGCPIPDEEIIAAGFDLEIVAAETQKCLDQLPGDPRFYTTSLAVDDIDAVRRALGIETLNLWGGSYGTRVALHHLRKYPDSTRSVIIDGVIAADQLLGPDLSIAAEASMQQLFARCAETESCLDRYGDLNEIFDGLRSRLREQPVTITVAHPRTGEIVEQRLSHDELAGLMRLSSYQPLMRALLPLMISEAYEGRYAMMAANAVSLNDGFSDMLAMGMHNSVVCSEDAPLYVEDAAGTAAREATYMGDLQFQFLKSTCDVWPQGPMDEDFHEPVTSDIPVMLLSGEYDPVTPPANADRAMETLSNAIHIVAPQKGHIASGVGCVPDLMSQFVRDLDVSAIDDSCVQTQQGLPFFINPTGPTP